MGVSRLQHLHQAIKTLLGTSGESVLKNRAFSSSVRMNGNQKLDVYNQEKQNFIQHFSQIVKVLTEKELGHPEIGDAIAWLKEVLEYNALGGKYNRGLTVVQAFQELVEPKKQDAESLQRALTVGWCVCRNATGFLCGVR